MSIGDTFKTCEIAPVSGEYEFVRHTESSRCTPTPEERRIPIAKGDHFPPCKSCKTGAIWRLIRRI